MNSTPAETTLGCFLSNAFGEEYLHAINRTAFNKIGAPAVFRQHFGSGLWNEDTLNIIVGSDSGLLIEHVQTHGVPEGSRFIFIEPPEILAALQPRFNASGVDKRIALCSSEDWKRSAQEFALENYLYVEKLKLLLSVGAADAFFSAYRDLYRIVKSHLDSWIWLLRGQLGSSTFIDCQLQNLAEDHTPALCLKNTFPGKTALILAGGPSLDAILPWAKQHRDELVIFAVSRISQRLLQEQLIPHLVFSIDPSGLSFDISKEMLELDSSVLFVNAYHVHPPLLGQWHGRHLYLGDRFPWPTPLNPINFSVSSGPTVTNAALAASIEMGFTQIILGGVDLCHSPAGFSHASGSNEHKAGPLLGHVGQWVETNNGQIAETEESLAQAVHDIGRQAHHARSLGCQIVNPAPDAARIPNVDHTPLAELRFVPLEHPAESVLDRAVAPRAVQQRRHDLTAVLDELNRVAADLVKIKQLAIEGIECNAGLFGREHKTANFRYKLRMDKIESRLNRQYKELTPLVKNFGVYKFLRIIRPDADKEWRDDEIETTGRVYYESYRDGAQAMLDVVTVAQRRVQLRLAEDDAAPDFPALFAHWRADRQPGRARVWRERHADRYATLTPEIHGIQAEFIRLEQEYTQRLHDDNTAHLARCRKHADLAKVQSKAALMFHNRDRDGLERLHIGLQQHVNDDAAPYLHVVEGYLAEFDERYEDALLAYQHIDADPLLEDVLLRISSITLRLEYYADAVLALDCLACISPSYLPMYAELLTITGEATQAAEIYARYLECVPDDVAVLLKLGKLYTQQGINDGARWTYQYVLQQEPDNAAARVLLAELAELNGLPVPA